MLFIHCRFIFSLINLFSAVISAVFLRRVLHLGKGTKIMVNVNSLSAVSKEDSKMYVWEKSAKNMRHRKSEWQVKNFLNFNLNSQICVKTDSF